MKKDTKGETNRKAYILTYSNPSIIKRLRQQPAVNISYNSRTHRQVLFYCDEKNFPQIKGTLKKAKGFVSLEESALFNEEFNF